MKGLYPWDQEEQLNSLVRLVSISVFREIERVLRPFGLTPQQGKALRILYVVPGSTHTDLERTLCIEKPSVTSLVNGMERKGWVERRQHEDDARIKQIFLTEAGTELMEKVIPVVEQVKSRINNCLTPEEEIQLRGLLKKVLAAYEDPSENQTG